MVLVRKEDAGQINRAAWDINQLYCVDERFIEALYVVVVRRSDDGGEGRLGLCEAIFSVLGGGHGADREGDVLTTGATGRERSGERGDQAVVSLVEEVWR